MKNPRWSQPTGQIYNSLLDNFYRKSVNHITTNLTFFYNFHCTVLYKMFIL